MEQAYHLSQETKRLTAALSLHVGQLWLCLDQLMQLQIYSCQADCSHYDGAIYIHDGDVGAIRGRVGWRLCGAGAT